MSGTQQQMPKSSSKLLSLSMSKQTRPEQCMATVFKCKANQQKKHMQFLVHVQFRQFIINREYFCFFGQCQRNVLLLGL